LRPQPLQVRPRLLVPSFSLVFATGHFQPATALFHRVRGAESRVHVFSPARHATDLTGQFNFPIASREFAQMGDRLNRSVREPVAVGGGPVTTDSDANTPIS
jgi:hypothetical protein